MFESITKRLAKVIWGSGLLDAWALLSRLWQRLVDLLLVARACFVQLSVTALESDCPP